MFILYYFIEERERKINEKQLLNLESNDKQNCYITFKRVMTINNTLIEDECFNWLNNFYFLNSNFVIGLDFGEFLFIKTRFCIQ